MKEIRRRRSMTNEPFGGLFNFVVLYYFYDPKVKKRAAPTPPICAFTERGERGAIN